MSTPVIDIQELANKISESSIGTLSGAFQTDQANVRDVTAVLVEMALRFHFDGESLYRHWDQEVFSEVSTELGDFAGVETVVSEFDWECLETKIGTTLLFESAASALKYLPIITYNPRPEGIAMHGMLATLSGDGPAGAGLFKKAVANNATVLRGLPLLFGSLSAVQNSAPADASVLLKKLIHDVQQLDVSDRFIAVAESLLHYVQVKNGEYTAHVLVEQYKETTVDCPWLDLIRNAVLYWLGETPSVRQLGRLQRSIDQATLAGVHWYAAQAAGLLKRCGKQRDTVRSEDTDNNSSTWLADLLKRSVDWQAQLQKIDQLCVKHSRDRSAPVSDDTRVVWFVTASSLSIEIQARQQKKTPQGAWSKGRKLELFDLLNNYTQLDTLCESDRQLCSAIDRLPDSEITQKKDSRVEVADLTLLNSLIVHPRIYRVQKDESLPPLPCTIELAQPHLEVLRNQQSSSATVRMAPFPGAASQHSKHWQIDWVKPDCLRVTTYKNGLIDVALALSEAGMLVPENGLQQLQKTMPSLSSLLPAYSDSEIPGTRSLISKEPDNTLHFRLSKTDDELHIALCSYPFGEQGPLVIPGVVSQQCGGEVIDENTQHETMIASIDDAMYKLCRNLQAEKNSANEILEKLPVPESAGILSWKTQTASEAFEFISALQQVTDKQSQSDIQVHWVSGDALEISGPIDCSDMHIDITGSFDWIYLDGELHIEAEKRIDIGVLFELLDDDHGRYVQVESTKVVMLSDELHRKLCSLRSISNAGRVHPLATAVLQEFITGMVVTGDTRWRDRLQRLSEAESLEPLPPENLTAVLRDYQLEGFQWMIRLAHWGAGACLADDMGLGKTFQAIAVVLYRAGEGPTLIAAPTSVCANWISEFQRFAPSLNVKQLADRNRESMLDSVGAGDVIVCSYGVLQNEIETISEKHWATIVADEAQSFKNTNTYRSDAMMMLQSDFRLITTGTPIENRLEELWNLFRFVNPELLGSRERFKNRFANPIENSNDEAAREQLKALVRPFILRRLKSEVLTELPSRTEITQLVELEPDERDFYESLRVDASERLKQLDSSNPEQRFQVLAELTRLRRACCHPRLVADEPSVESAKLRAFAKLVDELRSGGHRCLVFSQFVGHLALIREYLDKKNICYQYLDGSTSVKRRQVAVDKFQGGEGDLFLISLKAGNSGLNLTAADYVIHMDPWWNPAVEDQASDRAYRMGQTRPVTIYRLIIKNSIEEKIVRLHSQKRELSDGLLAGTDTGFQLSVDALMELVEPERQE